MLPLSRLLTILSWITSFGPFPSAQTNTGALAPASGGTDRQPARTILAIGAHAGDMELTAGALLIKQHKLGDRVVILHMTLGEGGNPRLSPAVGGARSRNTSLSAVRSRRSRISSITRRWRR